MMQSKGATWWPEPLPQDAWVFQQGTNRQCVRKLDGLDVCVPGRCYYAAALGLTHTPGQQLTAAVCEQADGEALRDACRRLLVGGWHGTAAELLAVAGELAGGGALPLPKAS